MSKNYKVSIGSFNFYIGIAMLAVVLSHTIGLFPQDSLSFGIRALFEVITYIGISGFAIISGYRLRLPGNFRKYIVKTCRDYLKLYYLFGLMTVIAFGVIHFLCFRYLNGTLKEMFLMAIGFLFAIYPEIPVGDLIIYSCGPLYFLVAFVMAEIITVFILTTFKKFRELIVGITVLIGSVLMYILPGCPFAFSQAMLLTGCLYTGYILREHSFYEKSMRLSTSIITVFISVCIYSIKFIPHMECLEYFIRIVAGILIGVVLVNYCIVYSVGKNKIGSKIKGIGKLSFFVLGAHAIEYYAIPWYLFVDKICDLSPELGILIIYITRLILILMIVKISEYFYKKSLLKS